MEDKVINYSHALQNLRTLKTKEQQIKTDIDKALYDLRVARDELRDEEWELIRS